MTNQQQLKTNEFPSSGAAPTTLSKPVLAAPGPATDQRQVAGLPLKEAAARARRTGTAHLAEDIKTGKVRMVMDETAPWRIGEMTPEEREEARRVFCADVVKDLQIVSVEIDGRDLMDIMCKQREETRSWLDLVDRQSGVFTLPGKIVCGAQGSEVFRIPGPIQVINVDDIEIPESAGAETETQMTCSAPFPYGGGVVVDPADTLPPWAGWPTFSTILDWPDSPRAPAQESKRVFVPDGYTLPRPRRSLWQAFITALCGGRRLP